LLDRGLGGLCDFLVILLQRSQVPYGQSLLELGWEGIYSRASLNSPSSMPSPTNQWTKARLLYIMSNLPSSLFHASAIAVVLDLKVKLVYFHGEERAERLQHRNGS